MPKRPPQGRGSGGRVTPSSKPRSAGSQAGASPATRSKGRVLEGEPKGRARGRVTAAVEGNLTAKATGKSPTGAGGLAAEPGRPAPTGIDDATPGEPLSAFGKLRQLVAPTPVGYIPPQDRPRPWWGSGDVLLWFVVANVAAGITWYLAASTGGFTIGWPLGEGAVAGEAVGRAAAGLPPMITKTTADMPLWLTQGLVQVPLWAGFAGGAAYVSWRKGRGLTEDFKFAMTLRDVPLGLVVGVFFQLVWNPLIFKLLFVFTGEQDVSATARELTSKATSPLLQVFLLLTVGFVAPVCEELFFRGLALQSFTRRLGVLGGVLTSSLFFALVHGQLIFLPALFPFAAALAWLVNRYDRLGPAIWAHVSFNLVTAASLVWNLSLPGL